MNSPPVWCSTVASFYNWRVVKQENILKIEDMVSALNGYQSVKEQFAHLVNPQTESAPLKEENGRISLCIQNPENNLWVHAEKATPFRDTVVFNEGIYGSLFPPIVPPIVTAPTKLQWPPNKLLEGKQALNFWNGISRVIKMADIDAGDEWYEFESCFITINDKPRVSNN